MMPYRAPSKLTDEKKALGASALIAALLVGPKEFNVLWPIASNAMGYPADVNSPAYRFTDAWLQKMRKAGEIDFKRNGRLAAWHLTESGRAAIASAECGGVA